MIRVDNFKKVLIYLGFIEENDIFTKKFEEFDFELKADFKKEKLIYPESKGLKINERQTCNFKQSENFVVFECVHKLLSQGYHPKHIELEPKWQLGHGASGGRADILVKDNEDKALLIIECKTAGKEFSKAWDTTQSKPTQLFTYYVQERSTKFIALYASDFVDEKVISNYYLINITDINEIIEKNENLKTYQDATSVEEVYKVWRDTYSKDYTTFGIFENNKAYDIGDSKPNADTLKNITSKDIQGKYHQFATILRQHNVSGRENAFDKLINLFLCKVVDEKENSDELKFYWKGKAYDNPFDFQDRLQKLYKNGMFNFLGEEITYVDDSSIEKIFKHYDLETIKQDIKNALKEQKFFTNNDFALIDVHNEKLFYQNFEVLLKISRMIEDISLTGSDENQFLGDMFEGFLDQGVKQSEGQFFTPMPIVKFIINSLPKKEKPKVIDYACGAGHFLNEYFTSNKESEIIGIEKEYRLSKVAKVSSFMYGSDMNIIYNDALSTNKKIKNDDYDVLIANPPYSVKGFLETLSSEDREKYELTSTIDEKSYTANNAIECFFIERSKQLLCKDAVAGIVVPSSILNKGSQNINTNKANVYVGTREIILKYFDIVAIAEFGSGTFGKTGTNTVTLFLKRRCDKQNLAGTFQELADKIFECKLDFEKALKDKDMLQKYCTHIEIDFEIYKTLLCENIDNKLFDYDIFKEYKSEFEKLTETKNRKKKTYYKNLTKDEKEKIEKKELIKYMKLIEKDKFYYFCLAYKNSTDVVIVKSPSNNNENKKFLGYEWSNAKGNEGIHYITKSSISLDDETLDEEDKRILENLQGLKDINTPLYNPNDKNDITKINKIISDNFEDIKTDIPSELKSFVNRAKLVDMLDFSRVDFNKALNLSVSEKIELESKWELIKFGEFSEIIAGQSPQGEYYNEDKKGLPFYQGKKDFGEIYLNNPVVWTSKTTKESFKNDVLMSVRAPVGDVNLNPFEKVCIGRGLAAIRTKELKTQKYIFEFININKKIFKGNTGTTFESISTADLRSIKIPLPPLDIQEEIVNECQKVDDEVLKANKIIKQTKEKIEKKISAISGNIVKLRDVFKLQNGKAMPKNKMIDGNIPVYGGNGIMGFHNEKLISFSTISIGRVGEYCGAIHITEEKSWISDNSMFIIEFLKEVDLKFLYYSLININLNQFANKASQPNISQPIILSKSISLPAIESQKQIVSKIEKLELKINEAKSVINSAKDLKEKILKGYLE